MARHKVRYPPFVILNGTTLRRRGKGYWRDDGDWGIDCEYREDLRQLRSICPDIPWMHKIQMFPVTREQYFKDNRIRHMPLDPEDMPEKNKS